MPDFLDEIIEKRQAKNPAFKGLVDAALQRRRSLRRYRRHRRDVTPGVSAGVKTDRVNSNSVSGSG